MSAHRKAERVNIRSRELVDRLAAEYALGTLRGHARRHFERWLVSPQVGHMVKAWEERLAALEPSLQQVMPSAAVWQGIEDRLGLRALKRAPVVRWLAKYWIALVASLLGFADAGTIYWRVELLGDNAALKVQVRTPHALPAGKVLELWLLPASGSPSGVNSFSIRDLRAPAL